MDEERPKALEYFTPSGTGRPEVPGRKDASDLLGGLIFGWWLWWVLLAVAALGLARRWM